MSESRRPEPGSTETDPTGSGGTADDRKPLTILMGADTFAPDVNGAARFAENLMAGLMDHGHTVYMVAPSPDARHGFRIEEHAGREMPVYRLKSHKYPGHDWLRFSFPWRSAAYTSKIIDEVDPDVVHFQSHIVTGRGLSSEARKRGIRVVGTNHIMPENLVDFSHLPKWLNPLAIRLAWIDTGRVFRRARAVTTPTRRAAEFLERNTGLSGVQAISCGINAADYTADFEPRTENRIVFVGRVTGEKNIDVLVRAAALLPDELEATVEIVGGGDQLDNLKALAVELGVADRVEFTGYVPDEELRLAYTRAAVLAMPSTAELQSIVTMEAMASGLPVVAADAMALPHLVHDGENGWLFPPGDAAALAERLERVLTAAPDELERMKRASLELIKAHDIQRTLATFEALYRGEPVPGPDAPLAPTADTGGERRPAERERA